jgi:hypothetical protein
MKNYIVSIVCPLQPEVPTNALQSVLEIRVWCFPRIFFLKTIYVLPTRLVALTARRRRNFGSQLSERERERARERRLSVFFSLRPAGFVRVGSLSLDRIFSWSSVGKCEELEWVGDSFWNGSVCESCPSSVSSFPSLQCTYGLRAGWEL